MCKKTFKLLVFLVGLPLLLLVRCPNPVHEPVVIPEETPAGTDWTILCYMDGDNNLEGALMTDIAEMQAGIEVRGLDQVNVIVLLDRIPGQYTGKGILYRDFTDTRLFRITSQGAVPLSGGDQFPGITPEGGIELNMGEASNLKLFIEYGKEHYPANHYALILSNHGNGARSAVAGIPKEAARAICWDDTDGSDCLYTAELTDVLEAADAVDLLVFDACLMGAAEVAYQYRCNPDGTFAGDRFSALYMVASAPNVWGWGLPYDTVFGRLAPGGGTGSGLNNIMDGGTGTEQLFDPSGLTPMDFGQLFVEEQYDDTLGKSWNQALALFDLSRMAALKTAVDAWAATSAADKSVFQAAVFGSDEDQPPALAWFDPASPVQWVQIPFFDLYSVATLFHNDDVLIALEAVVVCSFAQADFWSGPLTDYNGRYGLSVFCPAGDRVESFTVAGVVNTDPSWAYQWWYNSIDTGAAFSGSYLYGKLLWCGDGATGNNGIVENWFELLDSWYDDTSGGAEGTNGSAP